MGINLSIYGYVIMELSDFDNGCDVYIIENGFLDFIVNSIGFNFCLVDINMCFLGFIFILNVKFYYFFDGIYIFLSGGDL